MLSIENIRKEYVTEHGFFVGRKVAGITELYKDVKNPHLLTGQLNLLLYERDLLERRVWDNQYEDYCKTLRSTMLVEGLNTRHAPAAEYLKHEEWDAISLDEHDGIAFSSVALGIKKNAAIVNYGNNHGWSFNEKDPDNQKPFSYRNLIKGLYNLIKFAIKNKDWSGSDAMDVVIFQYPELVRLSRIRLPKDRAFLRLTVSQKPGLIGLIHLVVSLLYSAKKDKLSGHNRTFYRLLALYKIDCDYLLIDLCTQYYHKKMVERYGDNYLYEITLKDHGSNSVLLPYTDGITL